MSHWDFGRTPAEQHAEAIAPEDALPYGPGEVAYRSDAGDWADLSGGAGGAEDLDDEITGPYPITYERGRIEPDLPASGTGHPPYEAYDPYEPYEIWPPAPAPGDGVAPGPAPGDAAPGDAWLDDMWLGDQPSWPPPPHREGSGRPPRRGRRWLIPAGVALAAAAIGGATVLLAGGSPGRGAAAGDPAGLASTAPSAPAAAAVTPTAVTPTAVTPTGTATGTAALTMTQAGAVLAAYTAGANRANAARSDAQLAAVEIGSSYAIDTGVYRTLRADNGAPYPAFGPASAAYYIPRAEPAGPRWFVVRVANAFAASPKQVSSVEYLLFLQAAPGGRWLNAIEPYLLPGTSVPRIAVGGDGLATAVDPTASTLAAAPVQLPKLTAVSFDHGGPIAIPGNLADRADARQWQDRQPNVTISDRHAPATAGQAFALLTTGGGALVLYTVAAAMTISPPAGTVLQLNVPGLYSPAQSLPRAGLKYRDQFAAYDPPAGSGSPRIVADYSGITGKA